MKIRLTMSDAVYEAETAEGVVELMRLASFDPGDSMDAFMLGMAHRAKHFAPASQFRADTAAHFIEDHINAGLMEEVENG